MAHIIIDFKTTHQIVKTQGFNLKRQQDHGQTDFEIVKDILHHERVELIDFNDQNLDPEILVSLLHNFMALNCLFCQDLSIKWPQILAKCEPRTGEGHGHIDGEI